MSAAPANYFGRNNIKPDFLTAQKSLQTAEKTSLNPQENQITQSFQKLQKPTLYQPTTSKILNNKFKFNLKSRKSPLFFIMLFILIFVGGILSSMSMLASQLEDLLTRATDPQYTSYSIKVRNIHKQILSGKVELSDYHKGRLKKQGIEVTELSSGKKEFTFQGQKINSDNFEDTINNNATFREAMNKAKRGRVANFFDDAAEAVFKKIGITRNFFANYKQTGDNEIDTENYKSTMSNKFSGDTEINLNTAEDKEFKNQNGETEIRRVETGEDVSVKSTTGDTPKAKAENFISSTASKVADAGGLACAAMKVGNLIAVTVSANEIYQSIHYFLSNIENNSKTKAGDGNNSAINAFLNSLTQPVTTTYIDTDTNEEKEITGTSLESEGLKYTLSDVSPDKSKTKHYSVERTFTATTLALTTNGLSNRVCSDIQAGGAIISLATTAIPGGGFIKATAGFLINTALSVGTQLAIGTVLRGLIPYVASSLFTNIFDTTKGIPAGELLTKGAYASNSRVARSSSGQMPSSASRALSFQNQTNFILAQDAEIDRKNKSPLDITNQNTFLGSIFAKISPIAYSNSSIFSTISNLSNLTTKSILSPVYAGGEGSSYATTFNSCPRIERIGAKGDLYCNTIIAGDPSTNNLEVDDPTYLSVINPNLTTDENGHQKIIDGSRLAHFINFCTERDSPFGVVDANISSAFQTSLGTIGDNLPFLNDIVDIVNAVEETAAMVWATGEICVNSESNPHWDSEMKYYAHYVETNRILDQMGNFKNSQNPVTAYKADYLKKHPLDNSPSGYLARISGIKKSEAESVVAILNYLNFVDTYQPSVAQHSPNLNYQINSNFIDYFYQISSIKTVQSTKSPTIVYFDLRNRSLLV